MTIAKFHAEWLNLLEVNGPFVTVPVLAEHLRSGLEPTDSELVAELHTAQREVEDDPSLHSVWTRWVITRLLGFPDEVLREGAGIGPSLTHRVVEHGETLRPEFVVADQAEDGTDKARLLINIWPPGTDLTQRPDGERWAASPIDRIAELCRATTVRLGLVTNGDAWTLVDAPADGSTGTATWDAALWSEERATLDAFTTLLGVRRFFTVAANETLEALLIQSASAEAEVTDQLGKQVRAAVELLVDAMSRADRERNGSVFRELVNAELDQDLEPYIYEAAVTVLMRLVFLLSAEERGLFLLGDPVYDATYAVSTLLAQLDDDANRYGEDVLERRTDAWHRLLATFRMVHAGAAHANLRLPPYGGSLFDPDRFPFLEGRGPGQPINEQATALRIDNRTLKHILDALQVLRFRGKGGWQEARRLSFRSLDVEQIGHVYEGLLDHGVVQVTADAVALTGKNDPEVAVALIEEAAAKGQDALVAWLAELTGDKPKSIEKALAAAPDPDHLDRLASACDNDPNLASRIAPYLALLRTDLRGLPQVYPPDSYYVTRSSDRRSSGAYYTPRALAEEMVTHTLEPLVYDPGPAEGAKPDSWALKPSLELLNLRVCDMAMGSGAFLVSACRYLSERLLEAWDAEGLLPGDAIPLALSVTTPMPDDETDREVLARRVVADRCLYGVDRNPMAVEMAKLSLWLITLARDRPFTFVDHALRCGDSLLGITGLRQLDSFHLDPAKGRELHRGMLFDPAARIEPIVKAALEKRQRLESFPVVDVQDAERKRRLLDESTALLDQLRVVADLVVGAALATATQSVGAYDSRLLSVADDVIAALAPDRSDDDRAARLEDLRLKGMYWLDEGRPPLAPSRQCLHWVLEFPEVFLDRSTSGFDAVIGNPPFLGGSIFGGVFGDDYRAHIVYWLTGGIVGRADLCAYFFGRAGAVVGGHGVFGLIATSSIAEGHTRSAGLARLMSERLTVFRARTSVPWPTNPGLRVALCWLTRSSWVGARFLDDEPVAAISSYLSEESDIDPMSIATGVSSFRGIELRGSGFILSASERAELLDAEPKAIRIVRPFFGGADLFAWNGSNPVRWVIDFRLAGEDPAAFPVALDRISRTVKPVRDAIRGHLHEDRYWIFYDKRAANFEAIGDQDQVIVRATDSSTWAWEIVPADYAVLGSKVLVVVGADLELFGQLQSEVHYLWAARFGSKIGEGMAYRPSAVLDTYPINPGHVVADVAEDMKRHRDEMRTTRNQGLTKIYSDLHAKHVVDEGVVELRDLHARLDRAVVDSYGWHEVDLDHGFHETRQGVRFTISPGARAEVLERLLLLNHARHDAETRQGPNAMSTPGPTSRARKKTTQRDPDSMF